MAKPPHPHPNRLLVEGADDLRVISQFMGKFIRWGNKCDDWPVKIVEKKGIEPILKPGFLGAEMKSSGLKALGVLADANADPAGRWHQIRERARTVMPEIPEDLPPAGLVMQNDEGLRFGVWLMPDNVSTGMLETFLAACVPDPDGGLWAATKGFCSDAKVQHQAPYRDAHIDKAWIHAWLAVQDPPGQQLHGAVLQNILDPRSALAEPFVEWFCQLFEVQRKSSGPPGT